MDNYTEFDLLDTLVELGINYREHGKEIVLDNCPFCETGRTKKSDHCSFNRSTGVFNCVKCSESGNLYTFRRKLGLDPWKSKNYVIPDQDRVKAYQKQPETYFKAFKTARGIPECVLKRYGVGKASYGVLGVCRTYQYVDTDGTIVNIKYVNAEKKMLQEKNSRQIYYGTQFLDYGKPELYVTEGEDDCHALVSMGFDNVVSLPGGAGSYSEQMGQVNSNFKKIYLLFDNDKAGQEGAEKFSQKAGVWKCWNVLLPFKDARECLLNGCDIFSVQTFINNATQFKYSADTKLRPALHLEERLDRFESDCKINQSGITTGFIPIDDITGGLRGGDLFSIVANPGCFKTTTLMNIIKRCIDKTTSGISIFFSLEMQIEAEVERELQMYSKFEAYELRKMANKKTSEWLEIRSVLEASEYKRIYVSEENNISVDDMLKIIDRTEEVSREKCILVGIDYLDFVKSSSQKEYDSVKEVMLGIKKKIAKKLNIPVILLSQTNRDKKDSNEEVGLRSGKGGTAIEATSDFYLGLWRSGDRVVGRMSKHRRLVGSIKENPYLSFKIDKKNYLINEVCICEKPNSPKENTVW